MIPKIIHLCWLSGDAFPADIVKCLETWKVYLSDYEIWLWGKKPQDCLGLNVIEKHFDLDSTIWTKQAFEAKKYAFAADYIRLYALYNYGGIYLDADVIMYKSFNDLLVLPYFIGADKIGSFEAAVIGAEKGIEWIRDIFSRYDHRPFIKDDSSYDMLSLPVVFKNLLVKFDYSFVRISDKFDYSGDELRKIYVFDSNFFNSRDHLRVKRTPKSYCAHNYLGSWLKETKTLKTKLKLALPGCIMNLFFVISHNTWDKHKYDDIKIPFEG